MSAVPLQDDTGALLELFNRADSGPSPWGLSTHGDWIDCGKRASLRAAEKATETEPHEQPEYTKSGELNFLKVGLHYHKLMEARILRQLGTDLVWDARAEAFSPTFLEAIRLYRAYHANWGSLEERWGCRILGAEIALGEATDTVVRARLGGPLTGRMDTVIEVVDPARALANTGHTLMPGRYIFDYKTGKAHGSHDAQKFGPDNLQAQAYLWLHTLEHGEAGALGVIFERVIGHKTIDKHKSYASFVVYPQMDSEERLRALVQLSTKAQRNPQPNPLACVDSFGRACYFKSAGLCKGY